VIEKGDKRQEFTAHKSYVTKSSKFIRAAAIEDSKEASWKLIAIPDHDPAAFEAYLTWLYSNQITLENHEELCDSCIKHSPKEPYCIRKQSLELAHMFVLGLHLDDARFCNAIVDDFKLIALRSRCIPSVGAICYIWNRTSLDCQLRELFLQWWAKREDYDSNMSSLWLKRIPHDFLVDLLMFVGNRHSKALEEDSKHDRQRWAEKCSFHIHVDELDKCS
jgi:hypothetical protein